MSVHRSTNATSASESPPAEAGDNPRIPLALQSVFLASNRGHEVHKAPPEKAAMKTFFRSWMFSGKKQARRKSLRNSMTSTASPDKKKDKKNPDDNTDQLPAVVQFQSKKQHEQTQQQNGEPKDHKRRAETKTSSLVNATRPHRPPMSPQAFLDVLIHSRGYSTRRYRTLQTGYYAKPTAFQQASYNVYLVKLLRANDVKTLEEVLQSGISPNPCNAYGESFVHMVCRRGDSHILKILLERCGTSVQVSDDYGRTPLHDACWAATPSYDTVTQICEADKALWHLTDSRGAVPLSYVRKEHWPLWIEFLESKKDAWWPQLTGEDHPAPLIDVPPNSRPYPDPKKGLSIELAGMVASGAMKPSEAALLRTMEDSGGNMVLEQSEVTEDSDDEEYDSGEDSSSWDSDEDAELVGMSTGELADMMKMLNHAKAKQQQ